jgi:repressor of nif and glnA expression
LTDSLDGAEVTMETRGAAAESTFNDTDDVTRRNWSKKLIVRDDVELAESSGAVNTNVPDDTVDFNKVSGQVLENLGLICWQLQANDSPILPLFN